jgi:hypothetical protein
MSKRIKFEYEDYSSLEERWSEVPSSVEISSAYTFEDDTRWAVILREFVRFLEAMGYSGVKDQIVLIDKYDMEGPIGFFKTVTEDPTKEEEEE